MLLIAGSLSLFKQPNGVFKKADNCLHKSKKISVPLWPLRETPLREILSARNPLCEKPLKIRNPSERNTLSKKPSL